jgi:hypothetical protein
LLPIAGALATCILRAKVASETIPGYEVLESLRGYPKVTPEKPFTYPPPAEVSTSVIETGYPNITPEKPFTYPPPAEVSTSVIQTGYPKVTPEKPFTYPPPAEVSTSVIATGYPKVTPGKPLTYPPPAKTSTSAIETGYPKVTPEKPFTYPPPAEVSTSVIETGYPKVTPGKPFTYPPPAKASTSTIETGYPKVTPKERLTYLSPFETFADKTAIQGTSKLYPPNPIVQNSQSEISLRRNINPQILGLLNPFIYNTYKSNLELVNAATSSVENFVHSAPRLAASNTLASRMGAPEPSNNDGRYHPQDDKVNIRRSVSGQPGIDYPVFNSVPDTSFSCNGRPAGRCLLCL